MSGFGSKEVLETLQSIKNLTITNKDDKSTIDWEALGKLLTDSGGESHKDWNKTELASNHLARILKGPDDLQFQNIFKRVLEEGNWGDAEKHTAATSSKPWVVLVTGVNGIRKTTSIHQKWFKQALAEALEDSDFGPMNELPDGKNSFFRQLDFIIATVANSEFAKLYREEQDDVSKYSATKASIFTRYRTVAEITGALLAKAARAKGLNLMAETSGRDIAMFKYIDHFFPDEEYRKLVLHFDINDLKFAETSVDARMKREMASGKKALETDDPMSVVNANAGGPYGSSVLKGVQTDSNAVWHKVSSGDTDVGSSWFKANFLISGSDENAWSIEAVSKISKTTELMKTSEKFYFEKK